METPTDAQKAKVGPYFQDLQKFLSIRDYRQVLKISNKLLHSDGFRQSLRLAKCKASALLKMSRYDEVGKFVGSLGTAQQSDLAYEKSYALYRQFKNEEALEAIGKATINTPQDQLKISELRAQILYRLEEFSQARDIYKNLLRETSDDNEEDRETNLLACEASLALQNHALGNSDKVKITKVPAVSSDAYFNRGIIHIGNGDYKKAEKAFTNAKNELEAYDDLDPEELEQDLAPIQAQLGLIYQLQGDSKKSFGMYQRVLKTEPSLMLTSIINNNIIASNQNSNLFESKKKAKALQTHSEEMIKKMQRSQLVTMEVNKALVAYASKQFQDGLTQITAVQEDPVRAGLTKQMHSIPVIRAACLAKAGKMSEATSLLKSYVASSKGQASAGDIESLNLALAQLDLGVADTSAYGDQPGYVALALSRKTAVKDRVEVMRSAESQWSEADEKRLNLLKVYGAALLELGDHKTACGVYEELASTHDEFLPKYIEVVSKLDPSKGKEAAGRLPSAASLTEGVDVSKLEDTANTVGSRYAHRKRVEETVAAAAVSDKPKRKRKRKPRLPKNLGGSIDAERWIPLRDRTYYKGRRYGKKKGGGMRGPQGQANDERITKTLDANREDFKNVHNTGNTGGGAKKGKKKGKRR